MSIANYCGKTLTFGKKAPNGFITLFGKYGSDLPENMPEVCEVNLEADPGYTFYMRFMVCIIGGNICYFHLLCH